MIDPAVAEIDATMRAVLLDGPCEPRAIAARRVARPQPGDGEARVRVDAAAVNRSDVLNVRGVPITTYPRVPGRDFAGTVEQGPSGLVGCPVWGTGSGDLGFTRDGSHAEWLVVPATAVLPRPEGWTAAEAAAAGLSYVAAHAGFSRTGLAAGHTVLVTGAAGGVGGAAVALAHRAGARTLAAVLDDDEVQTVRDRDDGSTVIVTGGGHLAEEVKELTGGRGVDIVYDTVGNALFAEGVESLAVGGTMVVLTGRPGVTTDLDLFGFYRRAATLVGVNTTLLDCTWSAAVLRELLPGFADGSLPAPVIAAGYGLADAAAAYRHVETGARGRVVLTPGDPE